MSNINVSVPQFLLEMSKQLNEQDSRYTSDPLFEVRYKKHLVTEAGYNESHWEILDGDGQTLYHSEKSEDYSEIAEHVFENNEQWSSSFWGDYEETRFLDCTKAEFIECFNDHFDSDWCDLPDDLVKLHMQEVEVTVNSHFTEADAEAFIERKQHDYPKLYTYAISMCYCWNMIELRNWIASLYCESKNINK